MKVAVVSVGKAKGAVGEAIEEYETRTRRYFAYTPAVGVRRASLHYTVDHAYRDNEHCLRDAIVMR